MTDPNLPAPATEEDWINLPKSCLFDLRDRLAAVEARLAQVGGHHHSRLAAVEARLPWVGTAADVAPQVVPITTADGLSPVEPAPRVTGEPTELLQHLDWLAETLKGIKWHVHSAAVTSAAALLRQPAPAPGPVADCPWEREEWCDAEGRCWWGRCADEFFSPEWVLGTNADVEEFCSDAMPQICLPHWAIPIPQPPQGGEVEA